MEQLGLICRRCGQEHKAEQCPVCGQPRPELLATEEQRRAYRQRLYVTVCMPVAIASKVSTLLQSANAQKQEGKTVLATFHEENLPAFLRLWEEIGDKPECTILMNGQRRPYDRELWIPLMWIAASDHKV